MVGHGSKFSRKKEEAIAALLTQRNVEEAARTAGIGTQTLYRWMKEPEFQTAYREAKRAAFGQALARLQQGSSAAVRPEGTAESDGSSRAALHPVPSAVVARRPRRSRVAVAPGSWAGK
jgi:transposase-like protein